MPILGTPLPSRLAAYTPGAAFPKTLTQYTDQLGTVIVPPGAMDAYYAWRATGGATRGEIFGFGDSTMHGAGSPPYPWLERLRIKAVAAGLPDGGKGCFAGLESELVYDSPEINGDAGGTGFGDNPDAVDMYGGAFLYDAGTTAGGTKSFQFRTTCFRLWYMERAVAGEFRYRVNGGAWTTINAYGRNGQIPRMVYVTGLAANTTHTVDVENLDGQAATPPASLTLGGPGGGGAFTAGTYWWVVTNVFGGGETVASASITATVTANQLVNITAPQIGQDSIKLYRATSSGGPYQLVTSATYSLSAGNPSAQDTGGAVDAGTNPPTTGTTNRNLSAKGCYIAFAPLNATGFSVQRYAVSGQILGNFTAGWTYWGGFGLTYNGGTKSDPASYAVDTVPAAGGRVRPVLAVMELGFNDLTSDPAGSLTKATNTIQAFAACCRAAGCSGLILSGQLPYNVNWGSGGVTLYNTMKSVALAAGLAWADLFAPVNDDGAGLPSTSYTGGSSSPHLLKSRYILQADWLWDNLLGAT